MALILCLLLIQTVSASNNDSFTDLQDIINNGDSEIELNKDYTYDGPSWENGGLRVSIDKTITINGNNHVLDAKKETGIFNITGENVVLNYIIFKNGIGEYYGKGGAIVSGTNKIFINNCTFINNAADFGGAIYQENGEVNNCRFIKNTAFIDGGAIYQKNSKVTNSYFKNNHALVVGGAIYQESGEISNSIFDSNSAESYADSIYNLYGTVNNCTFLNNTNETEPSDDSFFQYDVASFNSSDDKLIESKKSKIVFNDSTGNPISLLLIGLMIPILNLKRNRKN